MSTDTPAPFDANPFAEAEERYILSTVDPLESAPEADEHVEGPKLLTKAQINHRKKLGVLVDQAVRHAKAHGIEFLSFFEGVNAPMDVKASCTPQLVRAAVAHLALVANKDFNDALQTLREMFPDKSKEEDAQLPDMPTPEDGEQAPVEQGQDAG